MEVRQSVITGWILGLAGIGTLIVSIIFCIYTRNQEIGVCVFEIGFDYAVHSQNGSYMGSNGFRLSEPIRKLPPRLFYEEAHSQYDADAEQLGQDLNFTQGQHHSAPRVNQGQNDQFDPRVSQGQNDQFDPRVSQGQHVQADPKQGQNQDQHGQFDCNQGQGQGHICTWTTSVAQVGSQMTKARKTEQVEESAPSKFAYFLLQENSSLLVKSPLDGKLFVKSYIFRFWQTSIIGIVASLAQIGVSLVYVFLKEKNIPSMSAFFYSYFFIFLTNLTCFCLVLNGKPNQQYAYFSKEGYRRATGDIFALILGLDCLLILVFTILTCVTCNTEEYSDRCIDEDTCNRARSARQIFSTAAASSTDRLNS